MGAGNNNFEGVLLTMAALLMGCSIHAAYGNPLETDKSWCVANPAAYKRPLQAALDIVCHLNPHSCKPLQPDKSCYEPNNLAAHASLAFNSLWQALRRANSSAPCDFGGLALIAVSDPGYSSDCPYAYPLSEERPAGDKMWCVAKPSADPTKLQESLDDVCGAHPNSCEAIQRPNQRCFFPNTVAAHASYAFNTHYQTPGQEPEKLCEWRNTAFYTITDPSYGRCDYV
ncbi:hypothetical protein GOP47_0015866 [Adiantum capillus-veneris]|uniref:X8 domain-containing protein n=1 Tax=Adiantum capillus-veneris TaxID=13818 RepID=A0A9D4ZDL8_ADICA|nr:hypothetical protein GOP47_0015866 [Adiantum capillus-veneris]